MATPPLLTHDLANPALDAYEALAPFYDDFTSGYAHGPWLEQIQAVAAQHGVTGGRVLDTACGTGKSSQPLLEAGWEVWACDLSPAMVAVAQHRLGLEPDRCFVADVCELGRIGAFDLVLCLDDSLNYLTEEGQLSWALSSMASVLARDGLLVFDLNTLHTYRSVFASEFARDGALGRYIWRGLADGTAKEDGHFAAEVEVMPSRGAKPAVCPHLQRHHSRFSVEAAAASAGLQLVACRGQSVGARLHDQADEATHPKVIYALCHSSGEGVSA